MFREIVFSLLLISPLAATAQEKSGSNQNTEKKLEMSIAGNPIYIGEGSERDHAEAVYGRKLPINAIFFQIRLLNIRHHKDLHGRRPELILYEDIENVHEGQSIFLDFYGKKYEVVCRQKGEENWCYAETFECLNSFLIKRFASRANWLSLTEASLKEAGVIDPDSYNQHGKNRSWLIP